MCIFTEFGKVAAEHNLTVEMHWNARLDMAAHTNIPLLSGEAFHRTLF